jgi:hypothetical protein
MSVVGKDTRWSKGGVLCCLDVVVVIAIEHAMLFRLYVELVLGAARVLKTPYYRSSSHTRLWIKMPLGANKSLLGAHARRELICPNRLCVARERGYSR